MEDATQQAGDGQAILWNGPAGRAWADAQEPIERMFKPFEDLLVDAVSAGNPGGRVLDVGCGAGGTTLAAARRVGAQGRCIGIDISEPLVATARARAEQERLTATFIRDDAQTHAFEPASFDAVISRFGVMFFGDFVEAFTNLRHAARSGAALRLLTWRDPAENPFMTTAERAAAPLLPDLPPRRTGAPGQFGLADRQRLHRILEESGWTGIDIEPIDVECALPVSFLETFVTQFGPLGRLLPAIDDPARARVIETVRAAFDPYVRGEEVRYTAACWMVAAQAPSTPVNA